MTGCITDRVADVDFEIAPVPSLSPNLLLTRAAHLISPWLQLRTRPQSRYCRKKEQSINCIHKQQRKMNDNANAVSSLEDTEAILSQMWTEAHEEINNIDPGELNCRLVH